MTYTADEVDYARERVAIMMEGEGLSYEEARAEVEKMIEKKRGFRTSRNEKGN